MRMLGEDGLSVEDVNRMFEFTQKIMQSAAELGIDTLWYCHDLLGEFGEKNIVEVLADRLGFEYSEQLVTWNGSGYEDNHHYQVPPDKYINGAAKANGRGGLVYKPASSVLGSELEADVRRRLGPSFEITNQARRMQISELRLR